MLGLVAKAAPEGRGRRPGSDTDQNLRQQCKCSPVHHTWEPPTPLAHTDAHAHVCTQTHTRGRQAGREGGREIERETEKKNGGGGLQE
jgi:hypothetical protein